MDILQQSQPSSSSDPNAASSPDGSAIDPHLTELTQKLNTASEKAQPAVIRELQAMGAAGLEGLMAFLLGRRSYLEQATTPDIAAGMAYQALLMADSPEAIAFLQTHFPTGVVPLRSHANIDYAPLQMLLAKQEFQTADQLTLQKMCELAGSGSVQRKWIYFTEVEQFPSIDLQTINALWLVHSEGKFGFSVQRDIWLSVGKNWDKLWPKIGWRDGNNWTRYPQGFTWDLSAPRGHLPLSNQLRGVRVMASLMGHPAWTKP